MIKLAIEEYCHNCPNFEPDVDKNSISYYTTKIKDNNTIITCEFSERCKSIYQFIEKQIANKETKHV